MGPKTRARRLSGQCEFLTHHHDFDFRRLDMRGLAAATARAATARRGTGHHLLDIRTALAAAQCNAKVDLKIFHGGGTGVEASLDLTVGNGFADADDHDENVKM